MLKSAPWRPPTCGQVRTHITKHSQSSRHTAHTHPYVLDAKVIKCESSSMRLDNVIVVMFHLLACNALINSAVTCSDPKPISILSSCHSNNTWACSPKAVGLFSKIVKGGAAHLISVLHKTTLHIPDTPGSYVTTLLHKKGFLSLGLLALSKIPFMAL